MIRLQCRTALDLSMERWPTELPTIPKVGDLIESATRHRRGQCYFDVFVLRLRVVEVTWKHQTDKHESNSDPGSWYPLIELHDAQPNRSIREFYEWYAPLVGKSVSAFI